MEILNYEEAFGATDVTSEKMRQAIKEWFRLYYRQAAENGENPCQRIAYTVVNKLVRSMFSEYKAASQGAFSQGVLEALDREKALAVQLALVGGESYLKPAVTEKGFSFSVLPRDRLLVFARSTEGVPTDVGSAEFTAEKGWYYTLLERRRVDENGYLTIENTLYRSKTAGVLGTEIALRAYPRYKDFLPSFTFPKPVYSVGLVPVKTPMLNCVDGSNQGVSLYAAAVGLIHAIDRNEYLLQEEFERGQSRIIASRDLLRDGQLQDNLFVGLDEDPDNVGLTVFAPELREQSYLARKQEYLRNVEALIGLQRGTLSDVNQQMRTATEISATQTEHCLTVMDFQAMWEAAARAALKLCKALSDNYGLSGEVSELSFDWGNGVLFDEEKLWQEYKDMVARGLLAPEVALGWRFGLPSDTEQQRAVIRKRYM